jgi:hypothetical protein
VDELNEPAFNLEHFKKVVLEPEFMAEAKRIGDMYEAACNDKSVQAIAYCHFRATLELYCCLYNNKGERIGIDSERLIGQSMMRQVAQPGGV